MKKIRFLLIVLTIPVSLLYSMDEKNNNARAGANNQTQQSVQQLLQSTASSPIALQQQEARERLLAILSKKDLLSPESLKFLSYRDNDGSTPLIRAAAQGDAQMVKAILRTGYTKFDIKDNKGNTAMDKAAQASNLEIIALLVDAGNAIDRQDKNGSTALHRAAELNHKVAIKTLLALHVDIDATNNNGSTPLMCAIYNLRADACHILLERNAHIDQTDNNDWSPMELINYFINNIDPKIEAVLLAQPERTQEEVIASCKQIESTILTRRKFLMQAVNMTPLMDACRNGNNALAIQLLQDQATRATVNEQDCQGRTALMYAVMFNCSNLVEQLYKAGAKLDLEIVDEDGLHVFHHAVLEHEIQVVEFILTHVADNQRPLYINARSAKGNTPLMLAAQGIHDPVTEYLLSQGANPLLRNKKGFAALDFAKDALESIKKEHPDASISYLEDQNNLIQTMLIRAEHKTRSRLNKQQQKSANRIFKELMKQSTPDKTPEAQAANSTKKKKKKKKSTTRSLTHASAAEQPHYGGAAAIITAEYKDNGRAQQEPDQQAAQPETLTYAQLKQQAKKKQQSRERRERKDVVKATLNDMIRIVERGYEKEQAEQAELAKLAQLATMNKAQEDALRIEVATKLTAMVNQVQAEHDDVEYVDNALADMLYKANTKRRLNKNFAAWRTHLAQVINEKERLMLRQSPAREHQDFETHQAFSQKPPRNYREPLPVTPW